MSLIRNMIDEFNEKHGLVRYPNDIERLAEITEVKVKRLHADAVIPTKAHATDAGFDLVAVEDTIIEPGETALIKTGIAVELPEGFVMDIRPRSGISLRTKLRVQYGTVDAGFTGEVGVIVDNIAQPPPLKARKMKDISEKLIASKDNGLYRFDTYIIRKGDRIAQAVIHRLPDVELIEVDTLGDSERGSGGFGSTGV